MFAASGVTRVNQATFTSDAVVGLYSSSSAEYTLEALADHKLPPIKAPFNSFNLLRGLFSDVVRPTSVCAATSLRYITIETEKLRHPGPACCSVSRRRTVSSEVKVKKKNPKSKPLLVTHPTPPKFFIKIRQLSELSRGQRD